MLESERFESTERKIILQPERIRVQINNCTICKMSKFINFQSE